VKLFGFVKNRQFWFFLNYFRIRELQGFFGAKKKRESKETTGLGYFKNRKEPVVFMKKNQE
jgi:hypothetical protein